MAAVAAVWSTMLGAGGQPAMAQPTETTIPTETEYAPATEAVPTEAVPTVPAPIDEVPTVPAPIVTPEIPVMTPPEVQAPVTTPEPQTPAPVTTTAAPQVTAETEMQSTPTVAPTPDVTTDVTTAATTSPTAAVTAPPPTAPSGPTTTPSPQVASTTAATSVTQSSVGTSAELVPGTTTGATSEARQPTTGGDTTAGGGTTGQSPVQQPAGVTQTPEPLRPQATPQDIALAQQAVPVPENPPAAPAAEINRLRDLVLAPVDPAANGPTRVAAGTEPVAARREILQWQPDWVQYDSFYRPLIFNPYPEPLQLVYDVGGIPRILLIPPLGRIVTEVRELGSYNFTVLRLNAFGIPIDIAVGNFFGGGYLPAPGAPPPPPPPPVRTLTDVPVKVNYTNASYRPIVVRKVVDVGPDPSNGGAHKVLLDGVTPAWGEWKRNDAGVPQFEVTETQSFPGMEAPGQGPLPGGYDLQLVSDSSPTGLGVKDIALVVAAVVVVAVGIGAIVLTVFRGRRRRPQH